MFAIYYISTSNKSDFVEILRKANQEFLIICNGLPIIINLTPFISYFGDNPTVKPQDLNIFLPVLDQSQRLPLTIPVMVIIPLSLMFTFLSIRIIKSSNHMSVYFKNRVINQLNALSFGLVAIYIPFITLNYIPSTLPHVTTVYQVSLFSVNVVQIPLFFYIFGFNCSIQQILVLKISLINSLHQSHLGLSQTIQSSNMISSSHDLKSQNLSKHKTEDQNRAATTDDPQKIKSGETLYELSKSLRYATQIVDMDLDG